MKSCAGFDIGNHAVHIAINDGKSISESFIERIPEGLVSGGRITSIDAMTDVIKDIRRKYKIRVKPAAIVLPAGLCYCRRFSVTAMTRDQLMFNLPYGFHDFITDDKSNYFFDCAIIDAIRYGDGKPPEFDVIAAATRKEVVADYTSMFAKAGFKLTTMIPKELSYINLLRKCETEAHRHGVLDIGHSAVRLYLFSGDKFESVRVIDFGCNALDNVIAEHFGVDAQFMAATYRESNFEGANELPECRTIYSAMAMEIRKAINFHRFNGGGIIEHIHCCGGGVKNDALMDTLRANLPVDLRDMSEFFGEGHKNVDYPLVAAAAGATMQ